MARTIVGVLRGGTSSEYDFSLKTGASMMNALDPERYEVRDIFIDKTGLWHLRGTPATPARALAQLDVALNALHGGVGEDGTVQRMLQRAGVPFAGSAALPSGMALNKIRAREVLKNAGVCMPQARVFSAADPIHTGEMARLVFAQFGPPYILKPPSEGSSFGIRIALTLQELPDALGDMLDRFGAVLVEEFVRGREAVVGLIENFRNEEIYALPPARVLLPERAQVIERAHYEASTLSHRVPSEFSDDEKRSLMQAARAAHRALLLRHFSQANFIVTPRRAYLLEVDALPTLHRAAVFPAMLQSVGSSVPHFVDHAIALARDRV